MKFKIFFTVIASVFLGAMQCFAQAFSVKTVLQDAGNSEGLPFATVSLTLAGDKQPVAYTLSDEKGNVVIEKLKPGKYTVKSELLGYKADTRQVEIKDSDIVLPVIKLEPDVQQLSAAKVSATGNPIRIKQDTIEFSATTFKSADNDVLEDLLKKIPGMEVSEDGSITHNGKAINKITIDGKTFFLDDPQLATKNIPAKAISKLKVVEKKSDQAQFTGIDDGEEETVLDLNFHPGMMKGSFGNVMAGAGADLPTADISPELRFQGAGFVGNFTDKRQLSAVVNANNTNNRGFNDLSGSMMGNMRGGGGGMGRGQGGWGGRNGITTSYMAGLNGGWTLFDGNMELGGNYLFSDTDNSVHESRSKTTYLDGYDLQNNSSGFSNSHSDGHRFGIRLDHKFSENTSILFEPRINFGSGSYAEHDSTSTYTITSDKFLTNDSRTDNSGSNKNLSTSGFILLRQKLGAPGRTLTIMGRYSLSTNKLVGINRSVTNTYDEEGAATPSIVDQLFDQNHNSYSLMGRATVTQPVGGNFYVEANYSYSWNRSESEKLTTDPAGNRIDSYSNSISNEYVNQEIGANLLYQLESFRLQLGVAAKPTKTHNTTANGRYAVDTTMNVVNWAPQAMLWWETGENSNARLFYRGSSRQPGINQLITVADNSNPLAVSFGNPNLAPYFSHTVWGDYRYNNKKTFASFNVRFDGTVNKNPIVNGQWYTNGISYSMPMNGPSNANANVNFFVNLPIAQSGFTIFNMTRFGLSGSSNYVGENIETSRYLKQDGSLDYNVFFADYDEIRSHFVENKTNSLSFRERFRVMYRRDNLELSLSGSTRINHAEYTLGNTFDQTNTFNNQIRASLNWTWDAPGLTLKSDFDYNWYHGYTTEQPSEYILNAEIQKLLFKKKMTLALKCYDILGQAKNITVTDSSNYHSESVNNTLGRYVILSLTYRFGTFDKGAMGGMHAGHGRMR